MAGALPPPHAEAHAPYAWVVEYRPLDRCSPPLCQIRTRAVHGYAKDVMEDGDPGSYVAHGPGYQSELFFERGVVLRHGESFEFDLPRAAHDSELDLTVAAAEPQNQYDAEIVVSELPGVGAPLPLGEPRHVAGSTVRNEKPAPGVLGAFDKYGRHVRLALPDRASRGLRVRITNCAPTKLALGSPLVMRRVEGRGPRVGIIVIHDALLFHEAAAFLFDGTKDAKADWVRAAVADRGVYFPNGTSPGQSTQFFGLRFLTGSYFAGALGWPGMYGKGFDETAPTVLPGPLARAAEQGFVTGFVGDNFLVLPQFANLSWDFGFNSEMREHPVGMGRVVETWARDRSHDDTMLVWWNAATHGPFGPGRPGAPAPLPPSLPTSEVNEANVNGCWRNLLDSADQLGVAYTALRNAAPDASRVVFLGADHSSAATKKMGRRSYRSPTSITTGLSHGCGGTSEEANTPFAIFVDDPAHRGAALPRTVPEVTSSLSVWRAFESLFDVDLSLPRDSSFASPVFAGRESAPSWDDRIAVSFGAAATLRARLGNQGYAFFSSRLDQLPAWSLTASQQLLLVGGPSRSEGVASEELFDDASDPYELTNLAGRNLEATVRMRRELTDWQAAHWDPHDHPRHRNNLVFSETVDLDLFAPRAFTALADDVPIATSDGRLAHVHGRAVAIVESSDAVGIVELRGVTKPLVLRCSANGLPLDVLTPERPRFNLEVARTNCPLPAGPHDVAAPGEVLFSFESVAARPAAMAAGAFVPQSKGANPGEDELLQGMKRWGYVRDIDEKKKP